MPKEKLQLSDFDYHLPQELIAQYPCAERDQARLLVLDRAKGQITHRSFKDIVGYFSPGDCLVLNNTKVIPARILGTREKTQPHLGGGRQELFFLEHLTDNTFRVLARPARKLVMGRKIFFEQAKTFATVISDEGKTKVIKFNPHGAKSDFWQRFGEVPLPPYIKRRPQDLDKYRYQTVYAKEEGATASPTAGLHFSKEVLAAIASRGVQIVYLTLHVNYGTFAPVTCPDLSKHKMDKEYFIFPRASTEMINASRAKGKKIFAVGTTSARVLETSASADAAEPHLVRPGCGWTDLFIYPPYRFKMVDGLLTNFHFPRSTLLMLAGAFAGRKLIFQAYQEAIKQRYRFFSYGDAMLIL